MDDNIFHTEPLNSRFILVIYLVACGETFLPSVDKYHGIFFLGVNSALKLFLHCDAPIPK